MKQIIKAVLCWMDATHRFRLRRLDDVDFARFTQAILDTMQRRGVDMAALPDKSRRVWGYMDATRWQIQRYVILLRLHRLLFCSSLLSTTWPLRCLPPPPPPAT